MKDTIRREIEASIAIKETILNDAMLLDLIEEVAARAVQVLKSGGKILLAGNGGSAADAQHIAGELVNRFNFDRDPLPGISLCTDTSVLTAIGNDFSFEDIFSKQVQAIGKRGDMFFGLSTSGNSANVIKALRVCGEKDITTVSMTGESGGKMREYSDYCIRVPSSETARIQESHIMIAHILCSLIESAIFGKQQG